MSESPVRLWLERSVAATLAALASFTGLVGCFFGVLFLLSDDLVIVLLLGFFFPIAILLVAVYRLKVWRSPAVTIGLGVGYSFAFVIVFITLVVGLSFQLGG